MTPFAATLTHDLTLLRGLRHSLSSWLELAGASTEVREAVVLATHEAVANGMTHGEREGSVIVSARQKDAGGFIIDVANNGGWKDARLKHKGRGLPMMRELMSDVTIVTRTTVSMHKDV